MFEELLAAVSMIITMFKDKMDVGYYKQQNLIH